MLKPLQMLVRIFIMFNQYSIRHFHCFYDLFVYFEKEAYYYVVDNEYKKRCMK